MTPEIFFDQAWKRYSLLTPDAPKVHALLAARGERIVNDHVALRTFKLPGIGRLDLGRRFEQWGYRRAEETLEFAEKKLTANYWLPPRNDLPKIFSSELKLEECSPELNQWVCATVEPRLSTLASRGLELFLEPSWAPPSLTDYRRFLAESEYAAWTMAFGIQINHFTVLVNALRTFDGVSALNSELERQGFVLNSAGGKIKGNPGEKLEQSSTLARAVPWTFAGGERAEVPGCYYEFAKRYPVGEVGSPLFQGFVPASANRLFESTHAAR